MNGLLPQDVAVDDILVTVPSNIHELSFIQIVGYTKSARLRYIHLHVSKSIANRQITYRVKSNPELNGHNISALSKPWKDGFLRLDGTLLEKYDPTKIYIGNTPEFFLGSDDESDGYAHVDSDFDD